MKKFLFSLILALAMMPLYAQETSVSFEQYPPQYEALCTLYNGCKEGLWLMEDMATIITLELQLGWNITRWVTLAACRDNTKGETFEEMIRKWEYSFIEEWMQTWGYRFRRWGLNNLDPHIIER